MMLHIWAMLLGLLLDFLIGDPEKFPHPVRFIGKYISFAEKKLRARGKNLRVCAVFLTASTVLLTMAVTFGVLRLLALLGTPALFAGEVILSWTTLSCKCLAKEANGVMLALTRSLTDGRRQVGRIVGRDTACLDEDEIIRATIETVAENTTDGVISPLLYLMLGGPVLAMGFKAASTLDSMVGYLDPKYHDIGWSSAKLDDVLNYIPARLTALLLCAAARICGYDATNALRIVKRDHANHLSPNCAWSEAAVAGALHIRLGGTHTYFGKVVVKPTIGDNDVPASGSHIRDCVRMEYAAALLAAVLFALIGFVVWGL